jgi:hypothetical protein
MGLIRVLSPVAESKVSQSAPTPLPAALAGRTVGFLDNTKTNFALLIQHMAEHLRERHAVAAAVVRRKANVAVAAPPEVLAAFAGVDLVVTGSAD